MESKKEKFQEGDIVLDRDFGNGVVVLACNDDVIVRFDSLKEPNTVRYSSDGYSYQRSDEPRLTLVERSPHSQKIMKIADTMKHFSSADVHFKSYETELIEMAFIFENYNIDLDQELCLAIESGKKTSTMLERLGRFLHEEFKRLNSENPEALPL